MKEKGIYERTSNESYKLVNKRKKRKYIKRNVKMKK